MKIIVDENISFAFEAFSGLGDTELVNGRKIPPSLLKEAESLIIRSTTNVNKELLEGTKIKFVGTATIGTDHVDLEYLKERNIAFASAAGCNSRAVAEYVITVIANAVIEKKLKLKDCSIGIIGIGNIGSLVERLSRSLGMQIKRNDPPLKRKHGGDFCSLKESLSCDFISLHVPLITEGIDKTVNLIDAKECGLLKPGAIFINASRGQVVNGKTLLKAIEEKNIYAALDVWETEPDIDTRLLEKVRFGSPHIAGYSLEGKANGTKYIYDALCSFLDIVPVWESILPDVKENEIIINGNLSPEEALFEAVKYIYPIHEDDDRLKKITSINPEKRGEYFDYLRKTYPFRREFRNFKIKFEPYNNDLSIVFSSLGFEITQ